ncbi:MAG: proton-conducting transporter membrane subunit [Planctomycetota bacterium]
MATSILPLLVLPAAALVAVAAVVPRTTAEANVKSLRRWVTAIAAAQLAAALTATFIFGWNAFFDAATPSALSTPTDFVPGLSIYLDGVSCAMFLMVSFVGWIICRYSIRYLDGDASQGNYFRWTAFTLGSVALMVVAGNMLLFFACWLMTSWGLHRLLLHDPTRAAAQRAAWTKFTVSRIGDGAFAIALIMLYVELGTLELGGVFSTVGAFSDTNLNVQVASFLLVAAAATKSAQLPFHTWLPQTLETPTPVSALMHAGIVNAGGYLIVRTSPIVSTAPWALTTLAIIGGVTACFAAIVMLTQTSVKKTLAYSTVAQMGFMMLQCGLGAFSAAMLHILAHSMYKAHAFLSSGSVIADGLGQTAPTSAIAAKESPGGGFVAGVTAITISLGCLVGALLIVGLDPTEKAGGVILGSILCLALARWLSGLLESGDRKLVIRGGTTVAGLSLVYATALRAVDAFIETGQEMGLI